jgi:ribonuclease HI
MLENGSVQGVIRALEIVDEGVTALTVYTDSKYTIQCRFMFFLV